MNEHYPLVNDELSEDSKRMGIALQMRKKAKKRKFIIDKIWLKVNIDKLDEWLKF